MLEHGAYTEGLALASTTGRDEQRRLGQFMTPPSIASFMARQAVRPLQRDVVRVLEPAAGSGVLIAAALRALCELPAPPRRVEVLAYEIDPRLLAALRETCERCVEEAKLHGVDAIFELRCEDFLLSALCLAREPVVDLVIANPPYFKLSAKDPRALAHRGAVHGQPNIYGLFMAATACLLRPEGRWCFITPRSWASGPYFKAVRRELMHCLQLDAMHVFESRSEHFEDDGVLQEAVVTWATAPSARGEVAISTSFGAADLGQSEIKRLPAAALVRGEDCVVTLPAGDGPDDSWSETLGSLGLKVSTGPTVAFRSRNDQFDAPSQRSVPLLWMQHVRRSGVIWPLGRPREHLAASAQTAWMLLQNAPMVLVRRFSPKEDIRRMTAAAYLGDLPCEFLGLENHLNYIHRPGGSMTLREVLGLTAVLNSQRADRYFRSVCGNTQINASDLRAMPLPAWPGLLQIADRLGGLLGHDLSVVDTAVEAVTEAWRSAPRQANLA